MSYYFNLPRQTELTPSQQMAVDEIESIALRGGPGTGKSVVSVWRHIRNYDLKLRKSLLLTYTKTLEYYLRNAASENKYAANNISRTYLWTYNRSKRHYDEIIIDEAQDVEMGRYSIIDEYADSVSYGADEEQSLYPDRGCSLYDLERLFPQAEEYELEKNFRNSREILEFTKSVFPEFYISQETLDSSRSTGLLPIVDILGWNNYEDKLVDSIVEIVNEYSGGAHNIAILLPSIRQVEMIFDLLEFEIDTLSKYHNKMDDFETIDNVHVTTFKSAKGLEFDTVIIPGFDSYSYFMQNPQYHISDKDYYVGLTRAKSNLYLLCKNAINIGTTSTFESA